LRQKAGADFLHKKGHEPEVGFALMQIDREPIRDSFRDFPRVGLPVKKKEIAPRLKHDRGAGGLFADGKSVL
jgi:hypothetical protein